MKYFILTIQKKTGEFETDFHRLLTIEPDEDITEKERNFVKNFWQGGKMWRDNPDCYEFYDGCIILSLEVVKEITKEEFDVLNKYLV